MINDNTLSGRLWLTRAIKGAKTIHSTQYSFTPTPTSINKVAILDKYGCKADGSWKVPSILPNPTLKQQIGFLIAEYMFDQKFDLVNSRVTDVTSATLPAINFNELEFLGVVDIIPVLTKQGWNEAGIQKILAAWADRVKA